MNPSHLFSRRLCLGALVCCSLIGVRADPLPTFSTTVAPPAPAPSNPDSEWQRMKAEILAANLAPAPVAPKLPQSLTSVVVDYAGLPRGESVKLLESRVSFKVKDASFLSALDAILTSANCSCRVECRGVKAMKLSLNIDKGRAAPVLNALALSGGARMWVFATKLIIAPEALLTPDEKKSAKPYGVLKSVKDLPTGSLLGRINDPKQKMSIIDSSHLKVSFNFNNSSWVQSTIGMGVISRGGYYLAAYPTERAQDDLSASATLSASLQDVSFGELLSFIAEANGCEVFLMPDHYLIFGADDKLPDLYKNAVPAFTSASTHFDFSPNPLDPSASGT